MNETRREFLATSAQAMAAGVCFPQFSGSSLWRAAADAAPGDRCLVVVELAGGNDGLNTVVPFAEDAYHKARPTLRIDEKRALKLDDRLGLHPELVGLKSLWDQGLLAIANGVGYPSPNRSHFESMDIWHTGDPAGGVRRSGWLGRYLEARARREHGEPAGLQIGGELSLAMRAENYNVPALSGLEALTLRTDPRSGQDAALEVQTIKKLNEAPRAGESDAEPDALAFARRAMSAAVQEGDRLRKLAGTYTPGVQYEQGLGQRLGMIARLIDGNFPTRVFYTSTGGYDTHAGQEFAHPNLHRTLGRALSDFLKDLRLHGHLDRVTVMAFSEFGRRVQENGSRGTDHGTAGPVFVAGGNVRPGIHSPHPSLTDLDQGDLKFTTDFRRIYAALLAWLGAELPGFEPLPLLGARLI